MDKGHEVTRFIHAESVVVAYIIIDYACIEYYNDRCKRSSISMIIET